MKNRNLLMRAVSAVLCAVMLMSVAPAFSEGASFTSGDLIEYAERAFLAWQEEARSDPERLREVTPEMISAPMTDPETGNQMDFEIRACTIRMNGREMHYTLEVIGEPDENGLYPLYITLHGGGEAPAEDNNEQWLAMSQYYRGSVENGIYVACRGMEDVWNLHFLDETYPMYDRLIEDMILLKQADPNRVYLLGFSAGGDGVYAVAPRMADRFAAVNMSSGHPNGVSLLNTSNLPFEIQVGIRDYYSEDAMRSIRGAEFEKTLNGYREEYGFGYPHRVLVHVPNGHNYVDFEDEDACVLNDPAAFAERAVRENWLETFMALFTAMGGPDSVASLSYMSDDEFNEALLHLVTEDLGMEVSLDNANAVTYVSSFAREPAPAQLVWDLSTRAPSRKDTAFYWLRADPSVSRGVITAWYDPDANAVLIHREGAVNGDVSVLVNPFLMDVSRPLTVITESGEHTVDIVPDLETLESSILETGDLFLCWAAEIPLSSLQ